MQFRKLITKLYFQIFNLFTTIINHTPIMWLVQRRFLINEYHKITLIRLIFNHLSQFLQRRQVYFRL